MNRGIRLLLIALVLIGSMGRTVVSSAAPSVGAGRAAETILVSDIDDTIRLTMIHHEGQTLRYLVGLFQQKAFIGMPGVYNFLAAKGVRFEYVSGTPQFLKRFFPAKFIELAGFPVGNIYDRQTLSESIEDFKYDRILSLMRANPKARFVLVGDNGQRDIATYSRLQDNPEVAGQISRVYIHKLYSGSDAMELREGQIPFFTSADLAVYLASDRMITAKELKVTVEAVSNGFSHSERSVRERTLPEFTTIDAVDKHRLSILAGKIVDPGTRAVFESALSLDGRSISQMSCDWLFN